MALAQGSSELIWWPYLIAKYGLTFLFLLLPACLLQYPLTYEIGRYTVLTGETIWTGFVRLNRFFTLGLWVLMVIQFFWFGAFASSGGTALAALTHYPHGWSVRGQSLFWGYVSIGIFLTALVFSKIIYTTIERIMWAVAVLTLFGLVAACTHPRVLSVLPTFIQGLAGPVRPLPRPWDPADTTLLLTAITFAGLGGFWTLFYSYWLHEKGVGMANYTKPMGGLTASHEAQPADSFLPQEDTESQFNLRSWFRFLKVDAGVGIVGNILTTLMACLLAYAVLFPEGLFPREWELAVVQAKFFELRWGEVGRMLFLVVAAAFLCDTWLSTVDAVSRVNTDIVLRFFPKAQRISAHRWYFLFIGVFTLITCATMPLAQPGPLIFISAVIGFAGTVLFTGAIWLLNFCWLPPHLPAFAQPRLRARLALGVSFAAYVGLAIAYLRALI